MSEATPESIMEQASEALKKLGMQQSVQLQARIALKNYTYTTKVKDVELRVNGTGLNSVAIEQSFFDALEKLKGRMK